MKRFLAEELPAGSSRATRGAWSGRCFGASTSYAGYKTDAAIVRRPRFLMPLRWPQKTQNDELLVALHRLLSAFLGKPIGRSTGVKFPQLAKVRRPAAAAAIARWRWPVV